MAKKAVTYAVNMSDQDKLEAEARHDIATERGCFMSEVSNWDVRERAARMAPVGAKTTTSAKRKPKAKRKGPGSERVADWAWANITCPACGAEPKSACIPLPEPPRTVCKDRFIAGAIRMRGLRHSTP